MNLNGSNSTDRPEPGNLARCMVEKYKNFILTGYELSNCVKVFDQSRKGRITSENIFATATLMFMDHKK